MSEYTSSRDGFQRAMQWSLSGKPEDAKLYAEATGTPDFCHIMNGQKLEGDSYVQGIAEWRAKSSEYHPVVEEFLRDGDQLAARVTGTIKADGAHLFFGSFMFAKIDEASGKMMWLKERSVWGPVGKDPEHGVN
ncbi:uncharacterized protein PV09_08090 [Verruconis gallopava]|uniref:SnoaL-like domain-containing protein n=1 Tax=Verruconis gallopava TaxID=253628 RepID=A0A0D2A225_9PEZI|nr:uncharacterized protein PV09_08090 [Verruconis gallopava]KIW00380.1 hypothetical protein PV09_08090 [Verruconis gallopava]